MKRKTYSLQIFKSIGALLAVVLILVSDSVFSQGAAINTAGTTSDPSAMLDVSSTNQGILIPRMTELQKNSIVSPANGLMIYQTDGTTGFWYYNGSSWTQAIGPQGPAGAAGVTGATGPTGSAASCPPANSGETLINYNGCLYVKNIDETGTYTWADANNKCESYGSGWYLPRIMELEEIYYHWYQYSTGGKCYGSNCAPLSGLDSHYWSSSICSTTQAFTMYFGSGYAQNCQMSDNTNKVRCVRR